MNRIEELVAEIKQAAKRMNRAKVDSACHELIALTQKSPKDLTPTDALSLLKQLRRKRMFAELERVAGAYLELYDAPLIQTLFAQALIDQGRLVAGLDAAKTALESAKNPGKDPKGVAAEEARGLFGRVYKQAFVQPGPRLPQGPDALRAAIAAYGEAFDLAKADKMWPGVNLLALLARATREQIAPGTTLDIQVLANEIEALIQQKRSCLAEQNIDPDDEPWLLASSIEVRLAQNNLADAVEFAKSYLDCQKADAFEFAGTARQLREIWQLDRHEDPRGPALAYLLEAYMLRKDGGFSPALPSAPDGLAGEVQSIFGEQRFNSYQWMRQGLEAANAVGRVETLDGYGVGTGFLVRGRSLHASWGERQLLLTNHHVIRELPGGAVRPGQAIVRFTSHSGEDANPGVPVDKVEWFSEELDVAVVSLTRHVIKDYVLDVDKTRPLAMTDPAERIYVIGHPRGEVLSYSMYDNEVVAYEAPYMFYRSPTLDGSSGSPLLSAQWTLLGIHHRGANPRYQANGGTLLRALLPNV